ncbi:MAG: DUF5343 domain-containing protein [Chloroflexi bacterium]|nr:DUF5343 domain-containing protein [Chloroflexota bacterium]MBI5712126.1 DUF5343 domain-containing protein [Chloroflexota bacterium]
MALTTAYMNSTKNIEGILNAMQTAQAPEKFTTRFLGSLEYKTAADRLVIGVLKGLGFLDDAGVPTERYFRFLDQSEGKRVLAEGIREAYDDLFRINIKSNELSHADVKNKLRTLTQGSKSDGVLDDMAKTFVELCSLADWTTLPSPTANSQLSEQDGVKENDIPMPKSLPASLGQLCYNIQIILPATRDPAVYDALFKSLREHLLK